MKDLDFLPMRMFRSSSIGTTITQYELYKVQSREFVIVDSFAIFNNHTSQYILAELGIIKEGQFYQHAAQKLEPAVMTGLSINTSMRVHSGESIAYRLDGEGATVTYELAMGAKIYTIK